MFALAPAMNPFHLLSPSGSFQAADLITRARLDPGAAVVVVAAGGWYLRARRRIREPGGGDPLQAFDLTASWPTVVWFAGLGVIVLTTMSGLATFAATNATIHMINDTLLVMVAPVLAVLGAPFTLAFAASGPRGRERIRALVSGPVAAVLTYPVVAWLLLGGALIGLYFGGLYQATVDHRAVADLVDLGLLVIGFIFAWTAIGVDPLPRARTYLQRLITLFLSLPYFTVLGMALDSQRTPIATGSSIGQLHVGGDVIWSSGVSLGIAGIVAVLILWGRGEERAAIQRDHTEEVEAAAQLALWRATREAIAMEEALARAPVVKSRPGVGDVSGSP